MTPPSTPLPEHSPVISLSDDLPVASPLVPPMTIMRIYAASLFNQINKDVRHLQFLHDVDGKEDSIVAQAQKEGGYLIHILSKSSSEYLRGKLYALPDTIDAYAVGRSYQTSFLSPFGSLGVLGSFMRELSIDDPDYLFNGWTHLPAAMTTRMAISRCQDLQGKYQNLAKNLEEQIANYISKQYTHADSQELRESKLQLWNLAGTYVDELRKTLVERKEITVGI